MYTQDALSETFREKYGPKEHLGWGPRLRSAFGYFNPDDVYETIVASLVTSGTEWLDVGCGRDIFPSNPTAARRLATRCHLLVGLDPSDNIKENALVHERFHGFLEKYPATCQFDLITLRMVAEHIIDPDSALAALSRLCKPGGRVIIYTVNRWSPVTLISSAVPFRLHHWIKKHLWNTEERDTFPTAYRMNTRNKLKCLLTSAGFEEEFFQYLDDCRSLSKWRITNAVELSLRTILDMIKLRYPEVCLLGVYMRAESHSRTKRCDR